MRNIRLSGQQVAVAVVLALVVGAMVWWQTADNLANEDNQSETAIAANPVPSSAADAEDSLTQDQESEMITLAVAEFDLGYYRPLIDQFEQQYPNIRVRLVSTSDVAASEDASQMQAMASSFDVFPYSPNGEGDTQYLLDLQPLLALDSQFESDDFLPSLLPEASAPLWAVPTSAAYQITYFDKAAFDDADLPYPKLAWTTEDFLAAALALTTQESGEVSRWGYIPGQLRYSPLLATQLAAPLQSGDNLRLTDPDVATAVQWMSDLFALHQVSPWLEGYKPVARQSASGEQSSVTLINNGLAAMWHYTHLLYDEADQNVGVAAVPHSEDGFAAEPIIVGFAVSRGTRSPEAAWQLVSFLSRQLPPDEIGLPTNPVPARRSVAAATDYWEQLPADLSTVLQYTAENSLPPRIFHRAAEPLLEALVLHLDDNVPVATALVQGEAAVAAVPTPAATDVIIVADAEPEVPADVTKITFTSYLFFYDQHQLLAEEFEEQHPGIIIDVKRPDDVTGLTSYDALLNGDSDCFMESGLVLYDEELRAAILPVGPLLDADGSVHLADFYPIQSSYFIENGELLALPAFMYTPLLAYNRELFREANLPEPSPDWTLANFLEAAQQLTTGNGETKQYGYSETVDTLMFNGLSIFEVDPVDESVGVPTFDFEAATEMMIWYTDLVRLYEVQSPKTGDTPTDIALTNALIREGRVAMWPFSLSEFITQRDGSSLDFDIGVAPEPMGLTGARGDLATYSQGFYIMADSPHREACWQWITFLMRHPEAGWLGHSVPAHIETAESPAYISTVGEEVAAASQAFMSFGRPSPHIEEPDWFFPGHIWLEGAYLDVILEQKDVATALTEADTQFTQYRQCLIDENGFNNLDTQIACALAADPSLSTRSDFPQN